MDITREGVILVDTQFERNLPAVQRYLEGITSQPVRYVLNTHPHGDHTGGKVINFPEVRAVHTGDLFVAAIPTVDTANGGSAIEWIDVIRGILEFDAAVFIPGRGPIMKRGDVEDYPRSFTTLRDRLTELKKAGRTAVQAGPEASLEGLLPSWQSRNGIQRVVTVMFREIVIQARMILTAKYAAHLRRYQ